MSFERTICDFLLLINSNLSPSLHRLATIHPLQTRDRWMDDSRAIDAMEHQKWKELTGIVQCGKLIYVFNYVCHLNQPVIYWTDLTD